MNELKAFRTVATPSKPLICFDIYYSNVKTPASRGAPFPQTPKGQKKFLAWHWAQGEENEKGWEARP